jgi:SP family general alpha glucoside:H+ symporter-like MFS transporter
MLIVLTFVYDFTVGPVCYVLVAEIPSTRLRVKTVVLARVAYNITSIITNTITPRMLNPSAWDWKGRSSLFFAGTTLICLAWCWFRLPEPVGLTYMELDILFEKKAQARKFKEFQVNPASIGYFSLTQVGPRSDSVWRG